MDTEALIWNTPALYFAVFGAFLFVVMWLGAKKLGITLGAARVLMVVGMLVCASGLVVMWGVGAPAVTIGSGAQYDLTMTESENQTIVDSDNMIWYVNVEYNYTGDGAFTENSGTSEVNFTLDRTDTGISGDTTTAECTDTGTIVDSAESTSHTVISKGIQFNIDWSKCQSPDAATVTTVTKTGLSTTLRVEAGGSNWVLCNITLNSDGFDAMPQFQNAYIYLSIGGVQVSIVTRVVEVHAGTAPT